LFKFKIFAQRGRRYPIGRARISAEVSFFFGGSVPSFGRSECARKRLHPAHHIRRSGEFMCSERDGEKQCAAERRCEAIIDKGGRSSKLAVMRQMIEAVDICHMNSRFSHLIRLFLA
jgi:hypothetical protein